MNYNPNIKKKPGRVVNFTEGFTPLQEIVAFEIAKGDSMIGIAEKRKFNKQVLWRWTRSPVYQKLIEKFKNELLGRMVDEEISNVKFLERTKTQSLGLPPLRRDGIRAAELLMKKYGELGKGEKEAKENLKNLSDKQLAYLKQVNKVVNTNDGTNTATMDR